MSLNQDRATGNSETHYDVLGLKPGASDDEIEAAYSELTALFAPSNVPMARLDYARKQRARLAAAYAVLGDPAAREDYDRRLAGPATPPAPAVMAQAETPAPEAAEPAADSTTYAPAPEPSAPAPPASEPAITYSVPEVEAETETAEVDAPVESDEAEDEYDEADDEYDEADDEYDEDEDDEVDEASDEEEEDEGGDEFATQIFAAPPPVTAPAPGQPDVRTRVEPVRPAPAPSPSPQRGGTQTPPSLGRKGGGGLGPTPAPAPRGSVNLPTRREAAQITARQPVPPPTPVAPARPGGSRPATPPRPGARPPRRATDFADEERAAPRPARAAAPPPRKKRRRADTNRFAYQVMTLVIALVLVIGTVASVLSGFQTTPAPLNTPLPISTPVPPTSPANSLLQQGVLAEQSAQWGAAETAFRNALQIDPASLAAKIGLAQVYMKRPNPDYAQAQNYAQQVAKQASDSGQTGTAEYAEAFRILTGLSQTQTAGPASGAAVTAAPATGSGATATAPAVATPKP